MVAYYIQLFSNYMPLLVAICFAGFTDETPSDYHCNLGPDGRRRDADERPELCRGTVEFVATKEFMVSDIFVDLDPIWHFIGDKVSDMIILVVRLLME